MESKGGKKSSSSRSSLMYEAPLGYSIEDLRPAGGIEKFRSAAYSNVCIESIELVPCCNSCYRSAANSVIRFIFAVLEEAILISLSSASS